MPLHINPKQFFINITSNNEQLNITLTSPQLVIRSLQIQDEDNCFKLFTDPIVMAKYTDGQPYTDEKKRQRFDMWTKRWQQHDPFSAYAVIEQQSDQFIGIIGIGQSTPGESELFYATFPCYWGKGYGYEMVQAVVQSLLPCLILKGYKCQGARLKIIEADTDVTNVASQKILHKAGFQQKTSVYRFGANRSYYEHSAYKIKQTYHRFFETQNKHQAKQEFNRKANECVDTTVAEMAQNAFGNKSSY